MSDIRTLKSSGKVAHASLIGQLDGVTFTEGKPMLVETEVLPLLDAPGGSRLRELVMGEAFRLIDTEDGYAFGFSEKDGYCGWVFAEFLHPARPLTHRVSAVRSYWHEHPDLKSANRFFPLSFGARVKVTATEGAWSRIDIRTAPDAGWFREAWMPTVHLAPINTVETDPVAVAEMFLGTPYLWGGNSAYGIDCSGLVQVALTACGIAAPGDSDQQFALGNAVDEARRGDLIFWPGHVAMVVGPDQIIHANAHAMAVSHEGLDAAITRIAAAGDAVLGIRRL